jgi:uncharacterized protein
LNDLRAKRPAIAGSIGFRSTKRSLFFGDPLAVTLQDPDHSASELRFITVGMSGAGRILLIAHTDRDECIRIINARAATQAERNDYEENN